MKKIVLIMVLLIFATGCYLDSELSTTSHSVYLDMPNGEYSLEICNRMCVELPLRIRNYKHENKVIYLQDENSFACKCY